MLSPGITSLKGLLSKKQRVIHAQLLFFNENEVIDNFDKVKQSDAEMFKKFFKGMLNQGIHFAPSPFESAFVSVAHSNADIEKTVEAARKVFGNIKEEEVQREKGEERENQIKAVYEGTTFSGTP